MLSLVRFPVRILVVALLVCTSWCAAQSGGAAAGSGDVRAEEIRQLRMDLVRLSARLDALEREQPVVAGAAPIAAEEEPVAGGVAISARVVGPTVSGAGAPAASPAVGIAPANVKAAPEGGSLLPAGATLNFLLDGYYAFNFNRPPGRVNDLRAYDVLSNAISINQADVVFALDPDVSNGRRYGLRMDLQFGQATDTLQGNPGNEPRPDVYRNIFQAYGSYIVPVGKGVSLDFGKWASSLGIEGNYTKDQPNYSRSYYFYYLPFYHQGVRASYRFNDKVAVNYWLVNGTNQSEPTNGFKDEMFGFVLTPRKNIVWTSNYYQGQEHADSAQAANCTIPVQPGLCVTPITPAPNGKLHIFDNYVTWQAGPKLSLAVEGDYEISREWKTAGPGESSAPSHVIGGVGYAQYQWTPKASFAARAEYLSDRGGLFSGRTQALKEGTGTFKYNLTDRLDAFLEYRNDWSNEPYFRTHTGVAAQHQGTATLGVVWWYGAKQGTW